MDERGGSMNLELSRVTKVVINVCTLIVAVGAPIVSYNTTNILPENVALTISLIVAIAGAIIHYLSPNLTDDPKVAEHQSVALRKTPRKVTQKKIAKRVAKPPVARPAD